MSKFYKAALAAVVAAAAPAAFAADPVTVKFDAQPGYYTSQYVPSINNVRIAGMNWSATADELGLAVAGMSQSFAAYCLDWRIDLNLPGKYSYSDVALDSVARLFAVTGFDGFHYTTDAVSTNLQQAALQLAIWEVSGDSLANYNLDAGTFALTSAPAATKALANQYLAAAQALKAGVYYPKVRVFSTPEKNNQPLVTTVPEPSTYAMLAACLGVIGLVMRRKTA